MYFKMKIRILNSDLKNIMGKYFYLVLIWSVVVSGFGFCEDRVGLRDFGRE